MECKRQSLSVRIWQRPQKNSIDQTEDRGISADTEAEDEDRRDGEPWRFGKKSERVAEMAHGGGLVKSET